jgi:glutamine synthetase
LKKVVTKIPEGEAQKSAEYCCGTVIPAMQALRTTVDSLEESVDDGLWPLPTYTELLFSR